MIWIHLSELSIDRLLAGELSEADAAAMHDHAADCTRCGGLLEDALAAQRAFALERPPLRVPADFVELHAVPATELRPPPRLRRRHPAVVGALGAVAALAAALAIVLAWPRVNAETTGVRTKGALANVGYFIAHDGNVRRGALHDTVMPHDRVQLYTSTAEPMYFAAISVDKNHVRSVYAEPRKIPAATELLLPQAIELDDALGREIVSGVFCDATFDAEIVDLASPPRGCTIDQFQLVKVAK